MQKLFKKASKWGLTSEKYDVCDLFKTHDDQLFQVISKSTHCLHHLLPPTCNTQYSLRQHGHPCELIEHKYSRVRNSFVVCMSYENIYDLCELLVRVITCYH